MAEIKIIFFDIDGTLVDHHTGRISDRTIDTLKQLHRNGILLCIATGRPTASLPDFGALHFDAFCTFNGSLCYADTDIIHSNPLSPNDVQKILENTMELGLPISAALRNRLAANGFGRDLADYYQLAGLQLTVDDDFESVFKEDIYQIMVGCKTEDHESIIRGTKDVKLAVSWDRAVDVIPLSSGKGIAISKILNYFNMDASQALAFGDSYNDMQMLQAVGTGIAMGNAPAQLKAIAADVCASVSEDGIYHYCIDHNLI